MAVSSQKRTVQTTYSLLQHREEETVIVSLFYGRPI